MPPRSRSTGAPGRLKRSRTRTPRSARCCSSSPRRGRRPAGRWMTRSSPSPEVARLIRERVVPVRVDADRRPDIADRYGAGGWPSTLLLTADGDPLCGGTYIDADQLVALIEDVADRLRADPAGIRKLAIEARRARQEQSPLTQTLSPGERASIFRKGPPFTRRGISKRRSSATSLTRRGEARGAGSFALG